MYLGIALGVLLVGVVAYLLVGRRKPTDTARIEPAVAGAGTSPSAPRAESKNTPSSGTNPSSPATPAARAAAPEPSTKPSAPKVEPAAATATAPAASEDAPATDANDANDANDAKDPSDVPDLNPGTAPGEDEPLTVMTRRFAQTEFQDMFQSDLKELFPESTDEGTNPTMPFALFLVSAIGQTDVGRKRKHNEDNFLILPEQFLFVIADGMGGHAAGEVASAMTVETMEEAFKNRKFEFDPNPELPRRGDELVRSIRMANRRIFEQALENPEQAGMGTTVVAARYSPNKQRVYIAHVGDSRLYRLRGRDLVQMTVDHTLESQGVKGPEAAKLTRAVGVDEDVLVDLMADEPQAGDQYLLCSDGLTKMMKDDMIRDVLADEQDIEAAVRTLIQTANERGGKDNVTVILVRVVKPDLGATA